MQGCGYLNARLGRARIEGQAMDARTPQAEQLDQQYKRTIDRSRKDGDTAAARTDPWAKMRAPNEGKR